MRGKRGRRGGGECARERSLEKARWERGRERQRERDPKTTRKEVPRVSSTSFVGDSQHKFLPSRERVRIFDLQEHLHVSQTGEERETMHVRRAACPAEMMLASTGGEEYEHESEGGEEGGREGQCERMRGKVKVREKGRERKGERGGEGRSGGGRGGRRGGEGKDRMEGERKGGEDRRRERPRG